MTDKTDIGEIVVLLTNRIEQLERENDDAAERAQQHQIDMQALRAKCGIAAYDDSDENERQNIRVQTMRDTIQRLGTALANAQEQLAVESKQFAETVEQMKRNFRRVGDELFDRNQEVLGLRDFNDKALKEAGELRNAVGVLQNEVAVLRAEKGRLLQILVDIQGVIAKAKYNHV